MTTMSQCYAFPPTTIPSSPIPQVNCKLAEIDDFVRCSRCHFGGCDIKSTTCGCSFHTRCFPLKSGDTPLQVCPACLNPTSGFSLFAMNFNEIDEAKKSAALALAKGGEKRGRKRKNSVISNDDGASESTKSSSSKSTKLRKNAAAATEKDGKEGLDLRTGRWTSEEMAYCDKLILCFKEGLLPVAEGTKLNDFLASVLRSKQSRLTKKMKNAKLSSNTYIRRSSFIDNHQLCYEFSSLEENFFLAINDPIERAELKFHMRKLWREMFSNHCLKIGQPLDVDACLSSVEEMDRRKAIVRDAARMQRRQLMMGYALCQDSQCAEAGVFIERSDDEIAAAQNNEPIKPFSNSEVAFNSLETEEMLALLNDDKCAMARGGEHGPYASLEENVASFEAVGKSSVLHNSPFLTKVMSYIKRHNVPFEHVDVWVPNFQHNGNHKCILGFAGSATCEQEIPASGKAPALKIDHEAKFNLLAFGDYSQKFSFSVGCGLPGRVFHTRTPTWESTIHSESLFERSGGASQWGIQTYVAIPIPSPNVGWIVIILYSRHERERNNNLIAKLQEEFKKLLPTPKWKLVIDMGSSAASAAPGVGTVKPILATSAKMEPPTALTPATTPPIDPRISEIVNLLADEMSTDIMSSVSTHSRDMISLRLLLLRSNRSEAENDLVGTVIGSYTSYLSSGRARNEIAIMVARDYAYMIQNQHGLPEVSLHHTDYNIGPPPDQGQFDRSAVKDPIQFDSKPTLTEFSPLDPKVPFYSIDGPDLRNVRPSSPALTPIELLCDRQVDNLSVVST